MIRRMHPSSPPDPSAAAPPAFDEPAGPPPANDLRQATEPAPPYRRIRVLVVDADRRVRSALATLMSLAPGLELVGSAGHPAGAVETLETTALDVVVIDPKLPDLDAGVALVRLVKARWPGTAVVALTWSDARDVPLDIPADLLLPTSVAPADLLAAVESLGRRSMAGRPPGVQ